MEFSKLLLQLQIDSNVVLDRFSGNEGLLKRFICKFPAEKTYFILKDAVESGEKKEQEMAVHTLKGISANLGFETLCSQCTIFLEDLRGEQNNLEEEFLLITTEYQRLVNLILTFSNDTNTKG